MPGDPSKSLQPNSEMSPQNVVTAAAPLAFSYSLYSQKFIRPNQKAEMKENECESG